MSVVADDVVESPRPVPRGSPSRRLLAALLVVLALLVGLLAWHRLTSAPVPTGYGDWVSGPTRGDRADDREAVASVLQAWGEARGLRDDGVVTTHLLDEPLADPHVAWVGTVDGATAAVVYQPVTLTPENFRDEDLEGRTPGYVFGFLGPGEDGELRIWSESVDWGSPDYAPDVLGGWVSTEPATALVLDLGAPLRMSATPVEPVDGAYVRTYEPVTFDADGAAVLEFPPGGPRDPAVLRIGPSAVPDQAYGLPGSDVFVHGDPDLGWEPAVAPEGSLVPISGLGAVDRSPSVYPAMLAGATEAAVSRSLSAVGSFASGYSWVLGGTLPDGDELLVGGFSLDGTARVAALVGWPGGDGWVDAGPLDDAATLPIAVRLPNRAGWVIGAPGSVLSYRAPGATRWVAAGEQAAFLPDADAWEIRVVGPSGTTVVTRHLSPAVGAE